MFITTRFCLINVLTRFYTLQNDCLEFDPCDIYWHLTMLFRKVDHVIAYADHDHIYTLVYTYIRRTTNKGALYFKESKSISGVTSTCRNKCTTPVRLTQWRWYVEVTPDTDLNSISFICKKQNTSKWKSSLIFCFFVYLRDSCLIVLLFFCHTQQSTLSIGTSP